MRRPASFTQAAETLRALCRDAWQTGMLRAFNGNASLRLPPPDDDLLCITASGTAKGRLTPADCCLADLKNGAVLHGGRVSTETAVHLALYRALPAVCAVLHTHPANLLALSLAAEGDDFLNMPLFEAQMWAPKLAFAPKLPPGSDALAQGVADAALSLDAADPGAVWMAGHGLCCFGTKPEDALALSEELEHLAGIRLRVLATRDGREEGRP